VAGDFHRSVFFETDREDPLADTESCADAGVALVAVPEVSGARTHGATRWLTPNRALIQLSLRYKWIDIFWFSFFHEAKHVLDQAKRSIVLDSRIGSSGTSEEEVAANRFAADFLIPPQSAARLRVLATESDVLNFAEELGIHPGIVVGRLHHESIWPHNRGNSLRPRLKFAEN
jgi:HTH-type transcriptional regulator/antitoxin HigA